MHEDEEGTAERRWGTRAKAFSSLGVLYCVSIPVLLPVFPLAAASLMHRWVEEILLHLARRQQTRGQERERRVCCKNPLWRGFRVPCSLYQCYVASTGEPSLFRLKQWTIFVAQYATVNTIQSRRDWNTTIRMMKWPRESHKPCPGSENGENTTSIVGTENPGRAHLEQTKRWDFHGVDVALL